MWYVIACVGPTEEDGTQQTAIHRFEWEGTMDDAMDAAAHSFQEKCGLPDGSEVQAHVMHVTEQEDISKTQYELLKRRVERKWS